MTSSSLTVVISLFLLIILKTNHDSLPPPLQTCLKSSACRQFVPPCCCCPTRAARHCGHCCACWVTWQLAWPRTRWLPPTWLSAWPRPSSTSTPCAARKARRRGACLHVCPHTTAITSFSQYHCLYFDRRHWHCYCISCLHNMPYAVHFQNRKGSF